MRNRLNLSSRPFVNHRLLWIAVVAVLAISAWLTMWVAQEKEKAAAQTEEIQNRIRAREAEVEKAKQDEELRRQRDLKVVISPQEQIQVASARQLISRKAFSWNRMIADIEEYVPSDARITSIKVNAIRAGSSGSEADLELKAIGRTTAQLTQTMTNLQKSGGPFGIRDVDQGQMTDSGEIPFTLMLQYRPGRGGTQ